MSDQDDTVPGLTQDADGVISIGPKASKHSLDKALADQKDAMQAEQDALNAELASSRAPGSEAGDDGPDSKKNGGS